MELGVFLLKIVSGFAGTFAKTKVMYLYSGLTKTHTSCPYFRINGNWKGRVYHRSMLLDPGFPFLVSFIK